MEIALSAEEYEVIPDAASAVSLLTFAAGINPSVPEYLTANPLQSIAFLSAHRVLGRLLVAIDRAGSPNLQVVRGLAENAHREHVAHFRLLQEKLAKFIHEFCYDMDVVIFKNHYYYAPSELAIRSTGDLDIAVSRPGILLDRLNSAGIPHRRQRLPLHEFVNVVFEGVDVDLHRYYPAWEVLPHNTHLVTDIRNYTANGHRAYERGLPIIELIANGTAVEADGVRFFVPSRTAAAAITLAASHRDFVTQAAWYLKDHPPQRLSDLCEVIDALNDATFSPGEFLALIRRQGLQDALLWFAQNARDVLGETRLLELHQSAFGEIKSTAIGRDWMLHLVAGGFWVPFRRNALRDVTMLIPTSEVTSSLGVPRMTLRDGEIRRFVLSEITSESEIGVMLSGHIQLDKQTIDLRRDGLTLTIAFNAGAEIHIEYRAYFELNGECLEWDNLYTPEVEYMCGSEAARNSMLSSQYDPTTRTLNLQYLLGEEQRNEDLHLLIAVSAPAMPWESERGYLAALCLRLE